MNRIIFFAISFVLVLVTSGFAMHHGGGMKGGGMQHGQKWWQSPAVAQMINLSAEEEIQVNDMWVEHRRKMIKLKGNLHLEKFELEVLDNNRDFDAVAFKTQFEKMQKSRAEVDFERMNYRIEVRNFLGSDRFFQIRAHFPMSGKAKMAGGKSMMGMKCGQGMKCGKAMMGGKSITGSKGMMGGKGGCCKMKGASGRQNMGSSAPKSVSQ